MARSSRPNRPHAKSKSNAPVIREPFPVGRGLYRWPSQYVRHSKNRCDRRRYRIKRRDRHAGDPGAAPDEDNKLSPPEIRRCTATTTLCERRSPVKRMPRPSPSITICRDAHLRFAIEPIRLNMAGSCSREVGCLLGTPVEPERASRREQAL